MGRRAAALTTASSSPVVFQNGTLILPAAGRAVCAAAGDLLISEGRVVAVGELESIPDDAALVDASGCAVLPGFVQTHVHLCQTLMRGAADDLPLLDWLQRRIWPLEAAHDPDSLRASARLGVAELLLGGTTALQSMETVRHTETVLEVLERSGVFAVAGKCLMDDPETSPPELVEPTDIALQEAVDLAEFWDGRTERLFYCLAPRFALSCTDACLRQVGELAAVRGWRLHTHAAENRAEVELVEGRTGRRNISYLEDVGCTGEHVGLAHCVWVDDDEIVTLARTGTHVLHCPGSNCKLASGIAPIPALLENGVSVSLGADGAPCNNTLDMFQEMRLAALLHKPVYGATAMPAAEVLWLATAGGAAALGQAGNLGVLAAGAWADVTLVDLEGLHIAPVPDVISALVYSARAADVRAVWVAGRQVVADGRLTLWDERQVRDEAGREADKLVRRAAI